MVEVPSTQQEKTMASAITFTATSLEAQIFEGVQQLQSLELATPTENRPNNVTIAHDFEGLQTTLTVTLPITYVTQSGGVQGVAAGTYI
jgi:hypothetical protein